MKYYQILVRGVLKRDLESFYLTEELSKVVNRALAESSLLRKLHPINTYKFFSFDGLYPVREEGYKKFKIYGFRIKTIDKRLASHLINGLKDLENDLLEIFDVNMESFHINHVDTLYTVTPTISVIEKNRHWIKEDYPIEMLIRKINRNIKNKYEEWFGEHIEEDHNIIDEITQTNNKIIFQKYKEGVFLTNKFIVKIKDDPLSQELGKFMFITGMLEKNSLGLGYLTTTE